MVCCCHCHRTDQCVCVGTLLVYGRGCTDSADGDTCSPVCDSGCECTGGVLVSGLTASHSAEKYLLIAGQKVYFSLQGWPVGVSGPVVDGYTLTEEDCAQLWNVLLQNPAPISRATQPDSRMEYQLVVNGYACRFQLATGKAFFDYYPMDGRMEFTTLDTSRLPIKN